MLDHPVFYDWLQHLASPLESRRVFVERYLRPVSGERLLDLGCGPARILDFLPQVDYCGIDANPRYIRYAEKKYGPKARLVRSDLRDAVWPVKGPFDRAMALGLLHHLPDEAAFRLLEKTRSLLKPGGRLVSIDGCREDGQSSVARLLLSMDRGRFVRRQEQYEALARRVFGRLTSHLERGLLRFPYTHLIMDMRVD